MANDWHYTLNGQQVATPARVTQLKQLASSGQLKPNDLVWQEGMTGWMPASSIKGLFPPGKATGDSVVLPPAEKTPSARPTTKIVVPRDWASMNPLLVLVLTVLTAGVFGVFYSVQVCRAYAARSAGRRMDVAGRTLGRVRHPFAVLVLSYLTLGFYFYYWASRVLRECNEYTGRKDINPRAELSLMLLFPPYAVHVVVFELPELVRAVQVLGSVPETPKPWQPALFLNPCLFLGLPFLGMLYQDILNQVWLTTP